MRVSTITTMNCPRCAAPVEGDYKYCPECACRLRPSTTEVESAAGSRGPLLPLALAVLLLLAGIFVGWQVVAGPEDTPPTVATPRERLSIADLPDSFVPIPTGIAWYHRDEYVLDLPADAFRKLVRSIPNEEREAFLRDVAEDPANLTQWARMLSMFYEGSEAILEVKEREEPVYVSAFKLMRYEVTRGQYKEFLRDVVERSPASLAESPWVVRLWRGHAEELPPDTEPRIVASWKNRARFLAWRYREDWWNAVVDHYKRRDNERRTRLAQDRLARETDITTLEKDEIERRLRAITEAHFPAAPPPIRPAFLGSRDSNISVEALSKITDAEAALLLVPPLWVRIDEAGNVTWADAGEKEDLPVTDISWFDARMFTEWARRATGINTLRLPHWGEWTRAFHGGNATRQPDSYEPERKPGYDWPWGNRVDEYGCNNLNNYVVNKNGPRLLDVRKVYSWHNGQTVDGILNMAGNAAEWTNNIAKNLRATEDGDLYVTDSQYEESGTDSALRCGGSFRDGLDDCKVSSRQALYKTTRSIEVGFRLALGRIL